MTSPIVITGGARRLGLAAARALHSEATPVVITYRSERPALAELRRAGITTIRADFGEPGGIETFCDELHVRYDALRAIVHNASEWRAEGGDLDDAALLERMYRVHVAAPYLINRRCGGLLQRHGERHGHADIIHLGDYVTSTGSGKHIAYAASKAALDNLTLSFATALAPRVKVNAIAPSLLMFNPDDGAAYRARSRRKALLEVAPGEAEGVNAIRYLLDSRYLTGTTIALDGGRPLARAS